MFLLRLWLRRGVLLRACDRRQRDSLLVLDFVFAFIVLLHYVISFLILSGNHLSLVVPNWPHLPRMVLSRPSWPLGRRRRRF
jgi:hypothetical protein